MRLFRAISPATANEQHADLISMCVLLIHTQLIAFTPDAHEYPELSALQEFWRKYEAIRDENEQPPATLFDDWQSRVGTAVIAAWDHAYSGAQAKFASAPPELKPDNLLTDAERADPN